MWMDQVYQVRAIMEASGALKDAPMIRELLDEALGARRRKALGITDSDEPPGQEVTETLHTLQTLLLKLIRREELVFRGQNVGLSLLQEALIEARAGRRVVFEELVEKQWIAKGKTRETMSNFFDLQTRQAKDHVEGVAAGIKDRPSRSVRVHRNLRSNHGGCRHFTCSLGVMFYTQASSTRIGDMPKARRNWTKRSTILG
jgi:hypothetical protein